jgi:hypothetical protein
VTHRALPIAHTRIRWLFASLHVTFGVIYLLYQCESTQKGVSDPPWPFHGIGALEGRWIALFLGGFALVNAWLVDSLLEHRTLQDGRTRTAFRVVRFFAASIPLVGIYVFPVWLELLDRKPLWAITPLSSASPPQQKRFLIFSSRTQWLRLSIPFFILILVSHPLLSGAGLAWLSANGITLFGVSLIDPAIWLLHLLGLAAALVFVATQRSMTLRVPHPIPWLLPLLWLLPFPLCLLGALVVVVFDPQRRSRSLVRQAFGGRQMIGSRLMELGQMAWWKLSLWQRLRWPSGRSPADPAEAEKRLVGLYRLKMFLLFPEAALFTSGLVGLAVRVPLSQLLINPLLMLIQVGVLALALLGGLLLVRSALRRLLRSKSEPSTPFDVTGRSLLLSALALLVGFYAGLALGRGEAASLANVLRSVGYVGMVTAGLLASPIRFGASRVRHRPFPLIVWLFVFAAIGYAGAWLSSAEEAAPRAMALAHTILWLAPVASIAIGALSFPWLLYPFMPRHIRDEQLPFRLRLALLVLAVTAWLPGGGIAVPLWAAVRLRLWPLAARLQHPPEPPRLPESRGSHMAALPPKKREYAIRHLIAHQARAGAGETLFQKIEAHPFFADQATCSGGFRRSSEDIEEHILPLILQSEDWERFLRYGSLAVNLRRIADDLADPDLLPVLARSGHMTLALDAAARISDPVQRALGRAALAASLDADKRKDLIEELRSDLKSLPPAETPEKEDARIAALVQIGLLLGSEIKLSLGLHETRPGLLRLSTAAGALQHEGGLDTQAWAILREIQEEQVLARYLPDLLGNAAATVDPARLLDLLSTLSLGTETLWACRLAILATQARSSPQEARESWEALNASPPLPWSISLIELGGPLFAILPESWKPALHDATAQTALRVVLLEHRPSEAMDAAAQSAIERLAPGPERLHWLLRRTAASPTTEKRRSKEVRDIGRQIFRQRYQAPPDDLRRYLELVTRCLPEEIQRRVEDVVLSPGGGASLLFHLAQTTHSPALLKHLFQQAETYLAALIGLPELEGHRLWQSLMLQLTPRLCALEGNLTHFEQVAEKLRDSDELAARVTGALAAAGHMELAARAGAQIRSGHLRLATHLRWLSEAPDSSRNLQPEPLYNSLASVAALEDEWLGLAALQDPDTPAILFQRYLDRIGDRDIQALSVFRLARHALDHQAATGNGGREGELVLQMLGQALGAIQSDARLAALTPWLPMLVAQVDPLRAAEEHREAFAHLIGLHTVPWPDRRDAIEKLLTSLGSCLFAGGTSPRQEQRASELFGELETVLAEGIPGQEEEAAADLLPMLIASLELLPAGVAAARKHPLGSRLRFGETASEQVRALCLASAEERARALEEWKDTEPPSRLAQAVAYLLLAQGPEQVSARIDSWPAKPWRDDLCRRLAVHGWVTGNAARELVEKIGDFSVAQEAELLIKMTSLMIEDRTHWLERVASRAADDGVDPSDPSWTPLLKEIWKSDPRQGRTILGEAVLAALGRGAPQTAETTLRLWLHAHLTPLDGDASPGSCDRARRAIRTALTLSPGTRAA